MKLQECCPKMVEMIADDNLITVADRFLGGSFDPVVYICSDGGHGGMEEIQFCPWCGRPIKLIS